MRISDSKVAMPKSTLKAPTNDKRKKKDALESSRVEDSPTCPQTLAGQLRWFYQIEDKEKRGFLEVDHIRVIIDLLLKQSFRQIL